MNTLFPTQNISSVKKLGLDKSDLNLKFLIELFYQDFEIDIKREIISSIGRQNNNDIIYDFLSKEAFNNHYMEIVYQMFRTTLYKSKQDHRFETLKNKILDFYDNEVLNKMLLFYNHKQIKKIPKNEDKQISIPSLLIGDNRISLKKIKDKQIQLIFTSPPYYNARIYSDYKNYKVYLKSMLETFKESYRVLEDGRFILINISPVITKRQGREFESIRYPIHFDFHQLLIQAGFYFIDEIIWIKPEYSVPNRIAGYLQTKKPLSYKPNCITESIMVYRKNNPFLIDENIKKYPKELKNDDVIDSTNCWYISPKSSKNHPAIFPEELCEKVLKYYSFKNDVVCDPFAGSGTFGKVAKKMERIPLLCEQNLEYANYLKKNGFNEI